MERDHTRFRPATSHPEIATFHVSDKAIRFAIKPGVFALSLIPAFLSVWDALQHQPTNPYTAIIRSTGYWSLRFLCLTLGITPLRWLTEWHSLIRFRRMMGLFAFFYGALHLGVYFVFDRIAAVEGADHLPLLVTAAQATLEATLEVAERPFFAIGFVAFALLVPLAATSTVGMIRMMGGHRWRVLHRLVYPAAIASVLHTYWPLSLQALRYEVILAVLLALRVARGIATR